jgi:LysR family transcriptional regulator, low CO2-responsive transcriptional regulator
MPRDATLRQLKVFEAVARNLSYSRAAEELYLTQPAVSSQIRLLEHNAGQTLLEQLGKKIYLTPAGTEMLHHSRLIIEQFREASRALARFKGVAGGKLNIAVISAGDYFFPRLLAEFMHRHEGIELNLKVFNREHLLAQLSTNSIDLAVMVRPPTAPDMVCEAFAPHPYVFVASPHHALAQQKNIPLSRIAKEAFIVRERGSDTWNSMEECFAGKLPKLNIAMEISSTETIKQAVIAGMGISFLSAHTISLELQVGHLVVLDVKGFPAMLKWYLVHRQSKHLPPVAQAFKDFLNEEGAALIDKITQLPALHG